MLPFPKRPPPVEELELRTDDYEALPPPVASRAPVFARGPMGMGPAPMGMTHSHPAPPNSLAPMALASARGLPPSTDRGHDAARDGKGRPDLRTGVMIALAGAMIGGTLGVAMNNAKRTDANAAARAERANAAPALPPTQAMTALPPGVQAPAAANMLTVPAFNGGTSTSPGLATAPGAMPAPTNVLPTTVPPTAFTAVAVGPATPPAATGRSSGRHAPYARPAPAPRGGGGRVSVATGIADSTPPPAPKAPKAPKGGGGGSTEADLLREAISEGGNSLGGSK